MKDWREQLKALGYVALGTAAVLALGYAVHLLAHALPH